MCNCRIPPAIHLIKGQEKRNILTRGHITQFYLIRQLHHYQTVTQVIQTYRDIFQVLLTSKEELNSPVKLSHNHLITCHRHSTLVTLLCLPFHQILPVFITRGKLHHLCIILHQLGHVLCLPHPKQCPFLQECHFHLFHIITLEQLARDYHSHLNQEQLIQCCQQFLNQIPVLTPLYK